MFKIGDKLTKENYTAGAIFCNKNNAMIEVINGEYVIVAIPEPLPPTKEEIQALRSDAYKAEVDPITCHIQRLGDEEQTPDVIAEIAALVEERKAKVEEIKARYPYPEVEEEVEGPAETEAIVEEPLVELYSMEI